MSPCETSVTHNRLACGHQLTSREPSGAQSIATSATSLRAGFDLAGTEPGLYDLRAIWPDEGEATLANAYEVVDGWEGDVFARLRVPPVVRPHRNNTLQIEYGNDGGNDMPAPLLYLTATPEVPMRLSNAEP